MKINNVSKNKMLATIEVMSNYYLIFLILSVVLFLTFSSSYMVIAFGLLLTVGFLTYMIIFWLSKNTFVHSLILEPDYVILESNNIIIERFNEVSTVLITKDEYKGKPIYTTFYNSLGINKIRITSEGENLYFVYIIKNKNERRKLIDDIESLREVSSYDIIFKNECQIFK